ncbi:hypothetical protein ACHWQZ_G018051 [Mnemiopsis leidyi]
MFKLILQLTRLLMSNFEVSAEYTEIPLMKCDRVYTSLETCDGWVLSSKDNCTEYCTLNKSPNPAVCPAPEEGCRYAIWFAKSGWCHLAGHNCQPADNTEGTLFVRTVSCTGFEHASDMLTTEEPFPVNEGAILKVKCKQGFILSGGNSVTCIQDTTFSSDTTPTCTNPDIA